MNGQHSQIYTVRCPNPLCDRRNRPEARFCGRCGIRLPQFPVDQTPPPDATPPADTVAHGGYMVIFLVFCVAFLLIFAGAFGGAWWLVFAIGGFGIAVNAGRNRGRRRHRHGLHAARRGRRHAR